MTTAIVMAGAGARGAYEAGILSVVMAELPRDERYILVGTSAGAINVAALAANAALDPDRAAHAACKVWSSIDVRGVFRLRLLDGVELAAEVTGVPFEKVPGLRWLRLESLFDTSPLVRTVSDAGYVDWNRFDENIGGTSWVERVAVTATSTALGNSYVFVQGGPLPPDRSERGLTYHSALLRPPHVLASSAIPIAFPAVFIPNEGWFSDGGVRLNTPIIPALDLGADRILIIATHPDPTVPVARPASQHRPDVFDQAASILSTLLVDRIAEDVRALRRINAGLEMAGVERAPDPRPSATGSRKPWVKIPHAYFGPPSPELIRHAASEVFDRRYRVLRRLSALGIIGHALGRPGDSSDELLSFLLFDREYMHTLVALGRQHARAQLDRSGGTIAWREL